jgi:hypothetical protein
MQDQGYYGEHQQKVNQSTCHMKHGEAAKPCDQQNDEQDYPNTHCLSPPLVRCLSRPDETAEVRATQPQRSRGWLMCHYRTSGRGLAIALYGEAEAASFASNPGLLLATKTLQYYTEKQRDSRFDGLWPGGTLMENRIGALLQQSGGQG